MIEKEAVTVRTVLFSSVVIAGTRFLFFKPEANGMNDAFSMMNAILTLINGILTVL